MTVANGTADELASQFLQNATGKNLAEAITLLARTERTGGDISIRTAQEAVEDSSQARLATGRDMQRLIDEVHGLRKDIQQLVAAIASATTKK